jgi:CubicO group peptidase (beta-lactamase class C family)
LKKNGVIYGAVQTGTHVFYALEQEKPEYVTSIASFTHVWLLENGQWRLTRGLSYNHHMPDSAGNVNDSLVFADRAETDRWLAKKQIPALGIGYIEDGKVKQVTVYGKGIDGNPHPDNMLFNVASLTKPVTAMVALQLVNEGKWTLDEPISKYWTDPDVAGDARSKKLTIRHILSHRSGFANWRRTNDGKKLVFEFEPGTKYQYSGEGFEYLRKAIENVTGKTLVKVADELIFRPLGMKDTRFYWDKTVDEARFARWHKADGTLYATYKNTTANGADDLLTTVADYSKFVVYVMNGAGLKKELYEQMTGEQVRITPRKYFGLGWWVDEDVRPGEDALVHGGDDKGVHTMAFVLPKAKQGLVIFTNCDNGTDAYVAVLQHYLGKQGQEIIDVETK